MIGQSAIADERGSHNGTEAEAEEAEGKVVAASVAAGEMRMLDEAKK